MLLMDLYIELNLETILYMISIKQIKWIIASADMQVIGVSFFARL